MGKTVWITGGGSGIGAAMALAFAESGFRVALTGRRQSSLQEVAGTLPDADAVLLLPGDVRDRVRMTEAAQEVAAWGGGLDVLCNNAGVMALPDRATKDGYDVQMQTNCISHFLLTKELFGHLKKSDDARIVSHTSMARLGAPLDPRYFGKHGGDLGGDGTREESASFGGPRWARYHQTKLANCAFTYGLKERLDARGITNVKALVAHPGLAATSLQTTTAGTGGMDMGSGFMSQAQSPEDGALGILRSCADPTAASGDFFGPEGWTGFPNRLPPEPELSDAHNVGVNWAGCEAAVGAFEV